MAERRPGVDPDTFSRDETATDGAARSNPMAETVLAEEIRVPAVMPSRGSIPQAPPPSMSATAIVPQGVTGTLDAAPHPDALPAVAQTLRDGDSPRAEATAPRAFKLRWKIAMGLLATLGVFLLGVELMLRADESLQTPTASPPAVESPVPAPPIRAIPVVPPPRLPARANVNVPARAPAVLSPTDGGHARAADAATAVARPLRRASPHRAHRHREEIIGAPMVWP